jgi:hypothetical protein
LRSKCPVMSRRGHCLRVVGLCHLTQTQRSTSPTVPRERD